jgi:hypothetical protein
MSLPSAVDELWSVEIGGESWGWAMIAEDGVVSTWAACRGQDRRASLGDGQRLWTSEMGSWAHCLEAADDVIYVGTHGRIFALTVRGGERIRRSSGAKQAASSTYTEKFPGEVPAATTTHWTPRGLRLLKRSLGREPSLRGGFRRSLAKASPAVT